MGPGTVIFIMEKEGLMIEDRLIDGKNLLDLKGRFSLRLKNMINKKHFP